MSAVAVANLAFNSVDTAIGVLEYRATNNRELPSLEQSREKLTISWKYLAQCYEMFDRSQRDGQNPSSKMLKELDDLRALHARLSRILKRTEADSSSLTWFQRELWRCSPVGTRVQARIQQLARDMKRLCDDAEGLSRRSFLETMKMVDGMIAEAAREPTSTMASRSVSLKSILNVEADLNVSRVIIDIPRVSTPDSSPSATAAEPNHIDTDIGAPPSMEPTTTTSINPATSNDSTPSLRSTIHSESSIEMVTEEEIERNSILFNTTVKWGGLLLSWSTPAAAQR
ncbi:hypothetical protein C8J56DRAFT_1025337 [Mycena floridula]|nr:hypothetical protein C8J56DRAFT_1025337 [Mycena floridula]